MERDDGPSDLPGSSTTRERRQSLASTIGASSYDSTNQDQEQDQANRSPSTTRLGLERILSGTSTASSHARTESNPPLERSQSVTDSSRGVNTRRREKAAVGFACLNCKKAHLACDVTRPCRRCVQMGRSSTCTDVPHKRRGRPRLRDSQQISVAAIPTISPSRSAHAPGSPVGGAQRRTHTRTGSINSPYMDFLAPALHNPWSFPPRPQGQATPAMQNYPRLQPSMPSPTLMNTLPGMQEPYRNKTATFLISVDLKIIRAFQDVQSFFCATPAIIEGRNLAELCQPEDRIQMPRLMHALQADVHSNRLLLHSHTHRQDLQTDLKPYSNVDLSHPFPGSQEHLLTLNFVDAMNRIIPSRMAAVLGSRSNDRFAYGIVSIQRRDPTPPAPRSLLQSSDRSPESIRQAPRSIPSPPPGGPVVGLGLVVRKKQKSKRTSISISDMMS